MFSLLLEQFLEGASKSSFVLLATPFAERAVVILLCCHPPLGLVPPRLDPQVLMRLNSRDR